MVIWPRERAWGVGVASVVRSRAKCRDTRFGDPPRSAPCHPRFAWARTAYSALPRNANHPPPPYAAPPPKKKKARKRGEMRVAEGNGEAARKGPREAEAVLPRPRHHQAALLRCAIRGPLPVMALPANRKSAAIKRVARGSLLEVPRCDARPRQNCLSEAAMKI